MEIDKIWPDSIIMKANFKAFKSGEIFKHSQVQSRFFVWCKSGHGRIIVNSRDFELNAGDYFFLPWCHRIDYHASDDNPFAINCLHLIPRYPRDRRVLFRIFHSHYAQSEEYQIRRDAALPGFEGIIHGRLAPYNPLILLSEFIIARFLQVPKNEDLMRRLAGLFVHELIVQTSTHGHRVRIRKSEDFPWPLRQMMDAIEILVEEPIPNEILQYYSKKSIPTIHRLFKRYLNMTPRNWINQRKILHAADLISNSELTMTEVANRICINDKFYFSRLFKKHMKITAAEYRRLYQYSRQS